MTDDTPNTVLLIKDIERALQDKSPELATILANLQDGTTEPDEAIRLFALSCEEDPRSKEALKGVIEALAGSAVTLNPTNQRPGLNPLVEAELIDRAQFDGDMPELRSGPLPEGVLPSVPVATRARNPVAVGQMLDKAAHETRELVDKHETARLALTGEAVDSKGVLALVAKHGELVAIDDTTGTDLLRYGSVETDHPSYKRGHLPAPVETQGPSGGELAQLPQKAAVKATWAMMSTSQGRRSVTPTILQGITQRLLKQGFQIIPKGDEHTNPLVVAVAPWTIDITGRESLQTSFAFVDVATATMHLGLVGALHDKTPRLLALGVEPSKPSGRKTVGWCARLYEAA